jgi:hypothetical protein
MKYLTDHDLDHMEPLRWSWERKSVVAEIRELRAIVEDLKTASCIPGSTATLISKYESRLP